MALFQRRPQGSDTMRYYTLGQNKTVLIVGLGNPGKEYEGTRHNIGFEAVDRFAGDHDFPAWIEKKDLKCHFTQTQLGEAKVIVIKPTTFMNLSGEAVQAVANFYKIGAENIIVVHDELDIPFGQIRTRVGGIQPGQQTDIAGSWASAVALQGNGRIVVAGEVDGANADRIDGRFALARYRAG